MDTAFLILAAIFVGIWILAALTWFYSAYNAFRAHRFFQLRFISHQRQPPFAQFDPSNYDPAGKPLVVRARAAMLLFMALWVAGFVVLLAIALLTSGIFQVK